jgi:hypothetical protein
MNTLYSLREWICECERFLFLAEVHYHKEDVIPSRHKFICEVDGRLLEDMLSPGSGAYEDISYCVSFDTCLSPEELCLLKTTLDAVSREDWEKTGLENVLEAQQILHKLGKAVDSDIMQTYESRGNPSFYKVCGVRYV